MFLPFGAFTHGTRHFYCLTSIPGGLVLTITVTDTQLADPSVMKARRALLQALPPPPLARFFSRARIVRKLCEKRIAACRLNRREQFIANLTGKHAKIVRSDVYDLLPPRRHWTRPGGGHRRRTDKDQPRLTAEALAKQVLATLDDPNAHYRWKKELTAFIDRVRTRALGWAAGDSYSVDRVVPIPKEKGGDGQKYRVVAIYSLEDGMIASGFASYLSTLIDPCLIASTLAFRPPPGPGKPPPNHHDAIDLIDVFRAAHRDRQIWCAECDIQGFFDAICHDTVRRSLRHILERAPVAADTRLLDFIESFLDGYSFSDDAVPEAHRRLTSKGISSPKFAEPLTACDASDVPRPVARYGIPQGSAMSCVLANVVLARADEACELVSCDLEREQGTRSLYVRYCDDIVILSTTRTGTERLLDTYLHQLRALRLPYHTPADSPYRGTRRRYGPKFWAGKSKKPYRWDAREGIASPTCILTGPVRTSR